MDAEVKENDRSAAARREVKSVEQAPSRVASTGGYAVQLAIRDTEERAFQAFAQYQARYGRIIGNADPIVRRAEVNGNTIYRIRVGPYALAEANTICERIKGSGGDCFVARHTGLALVEEDDQISHVLAGIRQEGIQAPPAVSSEVKALGEPRRVRTIPFSPDGSPIADARTTPEPSREEQLARNEVATVQPSLARTVFIPVPRPNTLAVVIGNRNYLEAPEVRFAHNDASAFARYFSDVMGVEAENVLVRNDLTSVGMARLLGRPGGPEGELHNRARFVDEIYVFYSGHGVPEMQPGGRARGYLLPVDVPPGAPGFGAYALDDLISQLESLPVARVTLLIDACFSGLSEGGSLVPDVSGAFGVAVTSPVRQAKVSVLAATAFDRPQFAHWLPEREHGAFTFLALSGLHGAADRAGEGRITLANLQRFIDRGLAIRGFDQRPSLVSSGEDELIMDFAGAVAFPPFER